MKDVHLAQGALLAGDGIPLHYGNMAAEYHAALESAVLMDRSHEGRLELSGRDRLAIAHRMSTQDLEHLPSGAGRATLFTNPNARILERAFFFNLGERALAFTGPSRGAPLAHYLQRNIFFQDEIRIRDLGAETHAFALHGPAAAAIIAQAIPALKPAVAAVETTLSGVPIFAGKIESLSGSGWVIMAARADAEDVWRGLLAEGADAGLRAAGSLTYHALRVRAGRPGVGHELTTDYIPLELGLWDEVSFSKGCYTGQEIIARMESRGRLARTIVRLRLAAALDAPAPLEAEGRSAGTLTSSVTTPDGEHLGIGVVRMAYAQPGRVFSAGEGTPAAVIDLAGMQPPGLGEEEP